MKNYKIEICINSVQSAIEAEKGGADRVELCSNMFEGGTTPSYGDIVEARKRVKIPIHAMVRPRGSDFCYSDVEFDIMKREIEIMKEMKIDGVVFGILTKDGKVDTKRCEELVKLADGMKITFHRAFDVSVDIYDALENIISLGFHRILTSGAEPDLVCGINNIKRVMDKAKDRIIIMPGAGINERNMSYVVKELSAKEYHVMLNKEVRSPMTYRHPDIFMGGTLRPPEYSYEVTDAVRVSEIMKFI